MPVLSAEEIESGLLHLPEWRLAGDSILRVFEFGDFREAVSFVNSVATIAERAGHHPDIDIRYNKVKLSLSSHDAGGITEKDFEAAREISDIL